MKINWAILSNSIVVNFDGKTKNISIENKDLYTKVYTAIKENKTEDIPKILDIANTINVKSNKSIEIRDGYVYIDGDHVNNTITDRILQYHQNNIPYNGLVEFWRNLKMNPSHRARERLFLFLENGHHPFTEDGHFIAYKAVTNDFKDIRTKSFDNSIGAKPSMDRSEISDDPTVTCAPGLHVASFNYLTNSGYYNKTHEQIYICVKVNPKNVVCIPIDYSNMKMRVCEYEVISLSDSPLKEIHYKSTIESSYFSDAKGDGITNDTAAVQNASNNESSSSSSSSEIESSSSSSSEESDGAKAPEETKKEDDNKKLDNSNPPEFVSSETIVITQDDSESESSSSSEGY